MSTKRVLATCPNCGEIKVPTKDVLMYVGHGAPMPSGVRRDRVHITCPFCASAFQVDVQPLLSVALVMAGALVAEPGAITEDEVAAFVAALEADDVIEQAKQGT